ncbi:hypothetical protein PBY51_006715 [Eleginops maclovinus]|uniref:Uncharacterized protein n=1 Tax=Eleginops maclovinus TaxID=56733 RepID=A0AAN7X2N2_ELEMC|nr:hypothetical protein PBY51_006715 [Eleginops maclovinus]
MLKPHSPFYWLQTLEYVTMRTMRLKKVRMRMKRRKQKMRKNQKMRRNQKKCQKMRKMKKKKRMKRPWILVSYGPGS